MRDDKCERDGSTTVPSVCLELLQAGTGCMSTLTYLRTLLNSRGGLACEAGFE